MKVASANSRAKKKGYSGRLTYEGVLAAVERCNGKCVCCESEEYLVLDHSVALAAGGGNVDENIQLLCDDCNSLKRHKTDAELKRLREVKPYKNNWRSGVQQL